MICRYRNKKVFFLMNGRKDARIKYTVRAVYSKEVLRMADSNPSPFAALSFSEQQEQWRVFRAQRLDFQEVPPRRELTAPPAAPARAQAYAQPAPGHHNLDRVRAQLAAASRKAGAFQPVPLREKEGAGCSAWSSSPGPAE